MFKRLRVNQKLLTYIQQPRTRQESDTAYQAVCQMKKAIPRHLWNKAPAGTLASLILVRLVNDGSLSRARLNEAGEDTYARGRGFDEEILRTFHSW